MGIDSKRTLRHFFLEQFNHSIQKEIIEFGKRLAGIEADYLIFMARKSVCFFECLSALKLTSVLGVATTDRVLDMNTSWLKGRRVAVIDDAVISGTSLYRINERLSIEGAKVVGNHVFCVSNEWWNEDTFSPTEPFLRLAHDETTAFCSDLVRAISLVPHPYAVDYPLYKKLRIFDDNLQDVFDHSEWQVRNISTPVQVGVGATSLVAIPSQSLISNLSESLGFDLSTIAQLTKIRLYGRHIAKHKATWFTAMPIVVLDPLAIKDVEQLWDSMARFWTMEQRRTLQRAMLTSSPKLRLLQFLISTQLAKLWLSALRGALGERLSAQLDPSTIRYAFAPNVALTIAECCESSVKFQLSRPIAIKTVKNRNSVPDREGLSDGDPWSMQARLIEPFLYLHDKEEIPARKLAKTCGKKAFENVENREVLNRLNRGFSISELRDLARGAADERTPAEVLSEFLDYAIDRGFVVPTTVVSDGIIYRAYRHGEDISDSEQFRLLVSTALFSFLKSAQTESIKGLWLEKLIVLLLQVVVERNYVPPSDLVLGAFGTIGVRYALHGAIVKEEANHLYSHYDGCYYTKVLCGLGILKEIRIDSLMPDSGKAVPDGIIETDIDSVRQRNYQPGRTLESIPCKSEAKELAEGLGLVIGCLYGGRLGFKITSNELIAIATCSTSAGTACALVSELDIFRRNWRYLVNQLGSISDDDIVDFLRRHVSYTSINSGRFKFRTYAKEEVPALIAQIQDKSDRLETLEAQFFSSKWRALWNDRILFGKQSAKDPCHVLVVELGKTIYELNILYRCIQLSFLKEEKNKEIKYVEIKELIQEYEKLTSLPRVAQQDQTEFSTTLSNGLKRLEEWFASIKGVKIHTRQFDPLKFRRWVIKQIDERVAYIPSKLEQVDLVAARHGKPNEFERFEHVLFIEFSRGSAQKSAREFDKYYSSAYIAAKKAARTYFASIPIKSNDAEGSRLVFARGDFAASELMKFAVGWSKISGQGQSKKMILFRNLPVEDQPIRIILSDQYRATAFAQRLSTALKNPQISDSDSNELLVIAPIESEPEKFHGIAKSAGLYSECSSIVKFVFFEPFPRRFFATAYALMNGKNYKSFKKKLAHRSVSMDVDIGLICMTPTELAAVLDFMKTLEEYSEDERFTFYSAKASGDQCCLRIGFAGSVSQGNVSVTSAYHALVGKYRPSLVVLIGMAGGIHKDVKLGDVVIADQVFYYEPKKSGPKGDTHRGKSHPINPSLLKILTHFQATHNSGLPKFESEPGALHSEFFVHVGPIGTGEEVVGYKNAETREWLQLVNDKVLVVETEAWGVTNSYYESNAWSSVLKDSVHGVLVIRGVADHADEEKESNLQYSATKHALKVLTNLLRMLQPSDLNFIKR